MQREKSERKKCAPNNQIFSLMVNQHVQYLKGIALILGPLLAPIGYCLLSLLVNRSRTAGRDWMRGFHKHKCARWPRRGVYTLDWGWAFTSFFSGLFFGLLRERTGSLIASGIAHEPPVSMFPRRQRARGNSIIRYSYWDSYLTSI